MLGRFLRLGLNVELAREANLFRIIDGHVEELREMLKFSLHVGVPQVVVTLSATPECVTLTAQLLGDFERLLNLRGSEGERLAIRARRGAMHVPAVAEKIGGSPEQ